MIELPRLLHAVVPRSGSDEWDTAIDLDDTKADIETVLSVHGYFRLTLAEARSEVTVVSEATSRWRSPVCSG